MSLALCEGKPLVTGRFPSQSASNVETIFIWWHRHDMVSLGLKDLNLKYVYFKYYCH